MKFGTVALAAAAIALMSGVASAASVKPYHHKGITAKERVAIARSQAHVNALKRMAWADGKLTASERQKIRTAENYHNHLVSKAHRG